MIGFYSWIIIFENILFKLLLSLMILYIYFILVFWGMFKVMVVMVVVLCVSCVYVLGENNEKILINWLYRSYRNKLRIYKIINIVRGMVFEEFL